MGSVQGPESGVPVPGVQMPSTDRYSICRCVCFSHLAANVCVLHIYLAVLSTHGRHPAHPVSMLILPLKAVRQQ